MTARTTDLILPSGLLADRPLVTDVPWGALYPATDTLILYRNNGTTWDDWVVVGAGGGGGSSAALVVDIVVDHGAVVDGVTDDTVAWQDALNAVGAAGGGKIISSISGVSVIAGALQDTSGANAQLLLPAIDAVDSEAISIVIEGSIPPPSVVSVIGTTPVPDRHLVLKSTLGSGSGGALLGGQGPVGTFQSFTNVHLRMENVTARMPANPTHTALDLSKVASVDLDNVFADTGSYHVTGLAEPTTATSYGIKLPKRGNGAHTRLGSVDVIGFYTGFQFNEHTNGQQVTAWGCKRAAEFTEADHASKFQRFMTVHCQRGIVFTGGPHYVDVDQFNIEHADTGWWITVYDIDDVSNFGEGSVRWAVVLANTGIDDTFTVNGATGITATRIGASAVPTVVRDRVVAAAGDDTLTLGATPIVGSPLVWVNNVIKWPGTDYTIAGAVITFTVALSASDVVLSAYQTLASNPGSAVLSTSGGSIVAADTFNRANSTNNLGTTDTGAKVWTQLTGTWGITSNRAYVSSGLASTTCFAVIDSGVADCTIEVTVGAEQSTTHNDGLIFRAATDSDCFLLEGGATSSDPATLYRRVGGGSFTSIGTSANTHFAVGDVISVVLSGTSIICKKNGTTIISVTDSTHQTQTQHGLYTLAGTGVRSVIDFENFSVTT